MAPTTVVTDGCDTATATGAVGEPVVCVEDRREVGRVKKTRRGKKKRALAAGATRWPWRGCHKTASIVCGGSASRRGIFQPIENLISDVSSSDPCSKGGAASELVKRRVGERSLRPFGMFAPENSTQFLIADHGEATDRLLEDLVSPNRSRCQDSLDADIASPMSSLYSSPAYSDIDFVYKSPDDIDMDQFLKDDFEKMLLEAHEEELMSRSKEDLIQSLVILEQCEEMLKKQVQVAAPAADCSLEDLVKELENLQQDNIRLKAENSRLRSKQP